MVTATDTAVRPTGTRHLATELRDTLLPDLLAVSMLVRTLRSKLAPGTLDDGTGQLLEAASSALEGNVTQVRSLIDLLAARSGGLPTS